jgi:hypothetical protein
VAFDMHSCLERMDGALDSHCPFTIANGQVDLPACDRGLGVTLRE